MDSESPSPTDLLPLLPPLILLLVFLAASLDKPTLSVLVRRCSFCNIFRPWTVLRNGSTLVCGGADLPLLPSPPFVSAAAAAS